MLEIRVGKYVKAIILLIHNIPTYLLLLGTLGTLLDLDDRLDDTDSDSLSHVTDSESAKRRVGREILDNHGLGGDEGHHAGISVLDELGVGLHGFTGTSVNLLVNVLELGSNVGSVAIKDGGVSVLDLTGVRHDDHLGSEVLSTHGRVISIVGSNISSLDLLDRNVLAIESDIVTGGGLGERLVMHLNGLNLRHKAGRGEAARHTGLDDTSLDTADGHSSDTTDLVDILEGKTKGLVSGTLGGVHVVKGIKKGRTLVPGHLVGLVKHVVTDPTRDGDKVDLGGLVADLLEVGSNLLLDIVVTRFGVVARVHLVKSDNHLLDTKGEGKKSVLTGLTLSSPTTFETTGGRVDDEDGNISLRSTSDHVLDEITMAGGINDSERVLGGLELPEGDIDGDTTLTLGLEVIKNPGVLEGTLTHLGSLLLELLDGTLVNTSALVDQMTSGGRLTSIDVSDDNNRNVNLLLWHTF
jgi:hypothetical protein